MTQSSNQALSNSDRLAQIAAELPLVSELRATATSLLQKVKRHQVNIDILVATVVEMRQDLQGLRLEVRRVIESQPGEPPIEE